MAGWARVGLAAILGSLVACSTLPPPAPTPPPVLKEPAPRPPAPGPAPGARWVAADWSDLPDWGRDDLMAAWPALRAGCQRPATGWAEFCARVALASPSDTLEAAVLLMKHLRPWRLNAAAEGVPAGAATGLLTGYFEPQLSASRERQGAFQWPVLALPSDPALRRLPRRELEAHPRMAALAVAWLDDPFALLQLQVQGSGRLRVREPDGRERLSRVAFAGHNDQPFQSVVRPLLDLGEVPDATPATLRDWARRNPGKVRDALAVNPRVVFFREESLPDATQGPRGAQGVPLTPGRSVAVDRAHIPLGTPLWLDSTEPWGPGATAAPLRRLVLAQDTGSAILGPVRADLFWGWGDEAGLQASRTKQPLRLWALLPQGQQP